MSTTDTASGPLLQVVATTPTEIWNEFLRGRRAGVRHRQRRHGRHLQSQPRAGRAAAGAASRGQTGRATCMPRSRTATEADLAWRVAEEMAIRGAALLEPVFEWTAGRQGRLSIQVSPALYRDGPAMVEQAVHFNGLAHNLQVKLPVTTAGLVAIEDATALGINVNATVNFTVPGAIAVAEAVERGLARREAAGHDVTDMHPVCTLMVGRLEDWMKVVCARDGILLTPGVADWAGVAAFKRAYAIYRERGYRTRLLGGAFRNHLPWSQLIGGDIVLTIPPAGSG